MMSDVLNWGLYGQFETNGVFVGKDTVTGNWFTGTSNTATSSAAFGGTFCHERRWAFV